MAKHIQINRCGECPFYSVEYSRGVPGFSAIEDRTMTRTCTKLKAGVDPNTIDEICPLDTIRLVDVQEDAVLWESLRSSVKIVAKGELKEKSDE